MALSQTLQILLPKKRTNEKGVGYTNTFNPTATASVLSAPTYRAHLQDIFTNRVSQDARTLMADLFKFDSDASAALHAYLTVANTEPRFFVRDANGEIDRNGMKVLETLTTSLFKRTDYTTGFDIIKSMREIAEDLRYMILLRGGCSGELVFSKLLLPVEIRQIDLATVEWFETAPGVYKPQQRPPGASEPISLDIANFFVKMYRQNPMEIYGQSMFVSAINTIAARQQVINDLYRIMQITGYPRMEATIVEEVLRKSAPANVKTSESALTEWMNARIAEISTGLTNMRADSAWVHTDAVEGKILNEKGPGTALDASAIIEVLNSQNQSALKTVATLIGRGESGVNTASVEARVFSMSADSLNGPIADMFSDMLSLALQLTGYQGYVECVFDKAELRPETELEPHLVMRQTRLLENLSLGLITDDEYHVAMFGRPRPDAVPELSGTGFMQPQQGGADAGNVSPNSDPLGRSVASPGAKSAKSNNSKTKTK